MTTGPGMAFSALRSVATRFGAETPGLAGRRVATISYPTAHNPSRAHDGGCGSALFPGRVLCGRLQVAPSLRPAMPRAPRGALSRPIGGIWPSGLLGGWIAYGGPRSRANYGPCGIAALDFVDFRRYLNFVGISAHLADHDPGALARSRGFSFWHGSG